MGNRTAPRRPMAWQRSLGEMKEHGTSVAQTSDCKCASRWVDLNLDALLTLHGPEWVLWDRKPPCPRCGKPGHYMASPGPGTPFRPLQTGVVAEEERARFLRGFGFTRRDIVRIKAMAETVTLQWTPAALNDLDVPYRVGACIDGDERHSSGLFLGRWAGRVLLYWEMIGAERDRWQSRRPGPRKV